MSTPTPTPAAPAAAAPTTSTSSATTTKKPSDDKGANQTYRIEQCPPPGLGIAPNGFPANAVPRALEEIHAPPVFVDAMRVRLKVFCFEQRCRPSTELDEDDPKSWSWVLYVPKLSIPPGQGGQRDRIEDGDASINGDEPVCTVRIVPPSSDSSPFPSDDNHDDDDDNENNEKKPKDHPNPASKEPYIKLTRVATMSHARGRSLSKILINHVFDHLAQNPHLMTSPTGVPWKGLVLAHAQTHVESMYARMGFVKDESMGVWTEEEIDHVGMWKRLNV